MRFHHSLKGFHLEHQIRVSTGINAQAFAACSPTCVLSPHRCFAGYDPSWFGWHSLCSRLDALDPAGQRQYDPDLVSCS